MYFLYKEDYNLYNEVNMANIKHVVKIFFTKLKEAIKKLITKVKNFLSFIKEKLAKKIELVKQKLKNFVNNKKNKFDGKFNLDQQTLDDYNVITIESNKEYKNINFIEFYKKVTSRDFYLDPKAISFELSENNTKNNTFYLDKIKNLKEYLNQYLDELPEINYEKLTNEYLNNFYKNPYGDFFNGFELKNTTAYAEKVQNDLINLGTNINKLESSLSKEDIDKNPELKSIFSAKKDVLTGFTETISKNLSIIQKHMTCFNSFASNANLCMSIINTYFNKGNKENLSEENIKEIKDIMKNIIDNFKKIDELKAS